MADANAAGNSLAIIKKDTVDVVAEKIRKFQENGEIHFPAEYSPENAMKSAWLILQEAVDKDKRPVLSSCSRPSIANALLNMAVQGLDPGKKQGYFIAYGNQLVFQRSYFGTVAVAKRVTGAADIVAQVVYAADEFEYEIDGGHKVVLLHKQRLENIDDTKIKAVYCTITWQDGRSVSEIMTIDDIKRSWKQSKMSPIDDKGNIKPGSTHGKFPAEMAKKTVIGRACKLLINSSDDSSLMIQAFHASDDEADEAQLKAEIEEHANGEVIDVEAVEEGPQFIDETTGEVAVPGF